MENNSNTISTSIRHSHKRTFSESDSSSRTERNLCSFSHLWIINYLSSYIDDLNSTSIQSETFSPLNPLYSNTRWNLKLYLRALNDKQHTNNNLAIFLKYVSDTIETIKAKAEFSVVNRANELVLLRSTNFHMFSSGNDWGYSEFLDGNYLNSRRNDFLADDRLRIYVRIILVNDKEQSTQKFQASTSNSSMRHGLFFDDQQRMKSFELLSNQMKTLFDDQRFTDVNIHVLPKQMINEKNKSRTISYSSNNQDSLIHKVVPLTTFHVHRAILISRSPSFACQIRSTYVIESKTHSKSPPIDIYIDDLEPLTVQTILIYMYTGHLPIKNDKNLNPIDLFRAVVKYNLTELHDLTKSTMLDGLKIENAIDMLEASDQANDKSLKQNILTFIRSNASTISKTTDWINFTKENPNLIIDAFRSIVTPAKSNSD